MGYLSLYQGQIDRRWWSRARTRRIRTECGVDHADGGNRCRASECIDAGVAWRGHVLTSWLAHNATQPPQHATTPETVTAAAILLHRLSLKFAVVLAWDMRNCAGALLQSSLARRRRAGSP